MTHDAEHARVNREMLRTLALRALDREADAPGAVPADVLAEAHAVLASIADAER